MPPRIAIIESSLRSFQYRLLNNILYLNERLFKFNIIKSALCSLCSLVNKTVVHLFCECKETVRISISGLKAFIKSIEDTERHVAQERDKL